VISPWQIRKFLLIQPRAETIRLTSGDAVSQEICPRRVNKSWAKIAETIFALSPELIELLDKDGNLIRAIRPDSEAAQTGAAPAIPSAVSGDPETARLTHFANLLHRAYEHSTDVAFTKLVELVERLDSRSDSIESRLERTEAQNRRLLQQQIDDAYERAQEQAEAAGGSGVKDEIMTSLLSGALQGQHAVNGKAKA